MPDKLFDNFVKEKLGNYHSTVPEDLWDKIIADKRRKPKGLWWTDYRGLLSSMAFVVILTGVLLLVNTPNNQTITNNTSTNIALIQTLPNKQTNATKLILNPSNAINQKADLISNNSKAEDMVHVDNANQGMAAASNNRREIAASIATNLYNARPAMYNKVASPLLIAEKGHSDHEIINQTNQDQSGFDKRNAFGELMNASKSQLYNRNTIYNQPLSLRSILGLGSDCPSANGYQRNDWYLEWYGSPDYTSKSLSGNGLSAQYLQKKDSSEKRRAGFTIGARFSKTIGEHFILKAGLQYAQINERFSLRSENQRQTTTVILSRTVVRPQGDTTFSDTSSVTLIGYAIRTNINHYRNIEIPISVGYEFGAEKDKWKIGLNGGVIVNIASSYVGETLDTSLNVVSYSSKNSSGFYNTKVGLSLYGGISLIRNLTDRFDVFAEPYFRYSLSDVSSSIGYSQRFKTAGLTLGVRMKLNRRQHF